MKFSHYKDKENVLKAYREKRKNILNQALNNPTYEEDVWKIIRVSEDFPERIIKVRYKLYPFLNLGIEEGRHWYLKYDRLMVDGQEYTVSLFSYAPLIKCKITQKRICFFYSETTSVKRI